MLAWWLVLICALFQVGFLVAEMFFWPRIATDLARLTEPVAEVTKPIGANMGFYNGILAAGLLWSLRAPPELDQRTALFFVVAMLLAGIVGGWTVSWKIAAAQAVPALLAGLALLAR